MSAIVIIAVLLGLLCEEFVQDLLDEATEATSVERPEDENGYDQPSGEQAEKIEAETQAFFLEVISKVCQSLIDSKVTVSMRIVTAALKKELKQDYVIDKLTQIEDDNT